MGTQVKETVTQMKTIGLKMDAFDDSPYSLMLLNNATQNEETTSDQRSGAIFQLAPVMRISTFRLRVLLIETGY